MVVVEVVLYVTFSLFTIPMALTNIFSSYADGTGKMHQPTEAVRPLAPLFIQMLLCWAWVLVSKNSILMLDPRCFYYMTGVLFANIVTRLIIAQICGSRCECFSPGHLPLAVAVIISIMIPDLSAMGELIMLYALTTLLTIFYLHYAVCALYQICHHLKVNFF